MMNNSLRVFFGACLLIFFGSIAWYGILHDEAKHGVSLGWSMWGILAVAAGFGILTISDGVSAAFLQIFKKG